MGNPQIPRAAAWGGAPRTSVLVAGAVEVERCSGNVARPDGEAAAQIVERDRYANLAAVWRTGRRAEVAREWVRRTRQRSPWFCARPARQASPTSCPPRRVPVTERRCSRSRARDVTRLDRSSVAVGHCGLQRSVRLRGRRVSLGRGRWTGRGLRRRSGGRRRTLLRLRVVGHPSALLAAEDIGGTLAATFDAGSAVVQVDHLQLPRGAPEIEGCP